MSSRRLSKGPTMDPWESTREGMGFWGSKRLLSALYNAKPGITSWVQ